jgi:hypothetical protein
VPHERVHELAVEEILDSVAHGRNLVSRFTHGNVANPSNRIKCRK